MAFFKSDGLFCFRLCAMSVLKLFLNKHDSNYPTIKNILLHTRAIWIMGSRRTAPAKNLVG